MNRPVGRARLRSVGLVIFAGAVAASLLWAGCSKDPVTPAPQPEPPFSIEDDIVLEVSPAVDTLSVVGDEATFDLSALSLVQSGEFNEFDIGYQTTTTCDINVDILNHQALQWDRFAFAPGGFCFFLITNQSHMLAEQNLSAARYVDANKEMKMRNAPAGVTVRALRINPKYDALSLAATDVTWAAGLHYDGSSLWLGQLHLFRMSRSGDVLDDIDTPVSRHNGLAWDGQKFWTAWNDGGQWKLVAFDKGGALSCSFDVAQTLDGGLTFAWDKLWVGALSGGGDPQILEIDPQSSCLSGNAQVDRTIAPPITEINALASDGAFIYIATDDEVVKFTTGEVVAETYSLPVDGVRGMSWHNGGLWMIHRGPVLVRTGAYFVSRFQLP